LAEAAGVGAACILCVAVSLVHDSVVARGFDGDAAEGYVVGYAERGYGWGGGSETEAGVAGGVPDGEAGGDVGLGDVVAEVAEPEFRFAAETGWGGVMVGREREGRGALIVAIEDLLVTEAVDGWVARRHGRTCAVVDAAV
jgi:hypothetical protein